MCSMTWARRGEWTNFADNSLSDQRVESKKKSRQMRYTSPAAASSAQKRLKKSNTCWNECKKKPASFTADGRLGTCSYLWSPKMGAAVDDEQPSELLETLLHFLCPHCKSPEVVQKGDADKPRNCKACGKEFIPEPPDARPAP
jgi:rubredoxin